MIYASCILIWYVHWSESFALEFKEDHFVQDGRSCFLTFPLSAPKHQKRDLSLEVFSSGYYLSFQIKTTQTKQEGRRIILKTSASLPKRFYSLWGSSAEDLPSPQIWNLSRRLAKLQRTGNFLYLKSSRRIKLGMLESPHQNMVIGFWGNSLWILITPQISSHTFWISSVSVRN